MEPGKQDITSLLVRMRSGDKQAQPAFIGLVYDELRRLAAAYLRRERPDHTLQPTALVHEAYLRLLEGQPMDWQNRAHFFSVVGQVMRHILVDHARARRAEKRGGEAVKVALDELAGTPGTAPLDLVELDTVLNRLARLDARQSQIVELKFFAGLTVDEISEALGVAPRTVKRDWEMARAWLYGQLHPSKPDDARAARTS